MMSIRITVEDRAIADSFTAGFEQCVFLSMYAEAGRKRNARPLTAVAPKAYSFSIRETLYLLIGGVYLTIARKLYVSCKVI